jgi:hypothetical protein
LGAVPRSEDDRRARTARSIRFVGGSTLVGVRAGEHRNASLAAATDSCGDDGCGDAHGAAGFGDEARVVTQPAGGAGDVGLGDDEGIVDVLLEVGPRQRADVSDAQAVGSGSRHLFGWGRDPLVCSPRREVVGGDVGLDGDHPCGGVNTLRSGGDTAGEPASRHGHVDHGAGPGAEVLEDRDGGGARHGEDVAAVVPWPLLAPS